MEPHEFWQEIHPPEDAVPPPWQDRFPARLPDGRILFLPIRALGDGTTGIASLILNQAGFDVETTLAEMLAAQLAPLDLDIVVGLPTLGLSLARSVAERLGHARYVPLGTSRKFWYRDELSIPLTSITSPGATKRLYIDPRLLPLLEGARVALIDDVISSGTSITAGLDLLKLAGHRPETVGAAMLQTTRWKDMLSEGHGLGEDHVKGVIRTPLLRRTPEGWQPEES
ncbi:phosphoribosyltransferase [Tropicimonas sediminicola]|uniref:Phosphoribosyl transferase domain-containing protein n=1 Tax=Tropicimonas sediminicola TaxID=1031541 RepID=A0A239LFN7_9RHOB|nr:phosphoribosyltransferase [Tropicimonas sediminicola]SNT28334.1 Phosphoribosyl transferase domain-containing protein [Tropicimonas sediminicola]